MNDYYGISAPSSEYLTHYGVKGMHWGVRKAIERGNSKALSRQYSRALKKLSKLNAKADIDTQKAAVKKHNRRALVGLGVGLAGLGLYTGNRLNAKSKMTDAAEKLIDSLPPSRKKRIVQGTMKIEKQGEGLGIGSVNGNSYANSANAHPIINTPNAPINEYKVLHDIAGGLTTAGLATSAYQKGRAIAAKYKTTNKGHAKAVAKRNAWQKEMARTFKGTKYANLPGSKRKSGKK